jgi:hypothetical protein
MSADPLNADEINLDYRDLSALDLAWQPRHTAPAEIVPSERVADCPVTSIGGGAALAFRGRAHGSGLCIDFAEFVDRAR